MLTEEGSKNTITKIVYDVPVVNRICEILEIIAKDTKTYSGLNLVTMIGRLNSLVHEGLVEERELTTGTHEDAPSLEPGGVVEVTEE